MAEAFSIPEDCPFNISHLHTSPDSTTSLWLIREQDEYGEFPHIYAKVIGSSSSAGVIVLSDTGCATSSSGKDTLPTSVQDRRRRETWNIRTFLAYTLNPTEQIPYLVITTHCHYDHILGLKVLLPATDSQPSTASPQPSSDGEPQLQILAPTTAHSFINPYPSLQRHSLCTDMSLTAPHYLPFITTWAEDHQMVTFHPHSPTTSPITTNIEILHTPGHSPDSLSWYDHDFRVLCVADSFYAKESTVTREAPWGREKPAPTIFSRYGDLVVWWEMMKGLLGFVRGKNAEVEEESGGEGDAEGAEGQAEDGWVHVTRPKQRRVTLAAGHVTYSDDAEHAIVAMQEFMAAILRDEVPKVQMDGERSLWDYALGEGEEKGDHSVLAPLSLVERARREIPGEEWGGKGSAETDAPVVRGRGSLLRDW